MPWVSEFFGVVIATYFSDHNPPHFHAEYAGHEAEFSIHTLEIVEGHLPRRAQALVVEWASLHRRKLQADWERARQQVPLEEIEPLD
jgi:hypothetical protein